ncbi:unnamed protein product [Adineta steineri]|uniref:Protein FAM221A n=1 Tax=Adineta steineri TaxID=433720 RepID=A0A815T3Q0_9BILA|nr:unnamed protein product [Adineta steineri]CAF1497900.1 unnamed protein product [Adineta steineri]
MAGNNRRRAPSDYISLSANAAAHVDAYFEYRAIVSDDDDDGGKVFSPEEYEVSKRRVLPMTDFTEIPIERPILISCRCVSFEYVANASATNDPNCRCKHSLDTHGTRLPYTYCNCSGFRVPFTCICGESAYKHITLVETKQEREQSGHPTGYATLYKATGGLTGFSRPDNDFLNEPIIAMDHPMFRAHASLDSNSKYDFILLINDFIVFIKGTEAQSHLSRGIRAAPNPYDTHAQLTTSIQNNKSPPRRITGDKK